MGEQVLEESAERVVATMPVEGNRHSPGPFPDHSRGHHHPRGHRGAPVHPAHNQLH